MPAATYDLELEQGSTFVVSYRWTQQDHTPISLSGRTPYMAILREGIVVLDSDVIGGIALTVEPAGATGRINVTISGTVTRKLLRPFGTLGDLRYRLSVTDPSDAGNTVHLAHGLVTVGEE
jgi:hypothetical protein